MPRDSNKFRETIVMHRSEEDNTPDLIKPMTQSRLQALHNDTNDFLDPNWKTDVLTHKFDEGFITLSEESDNSQSKSVDYLVMQYKRIKPNI
jgi:hypothetical protein